MSILMDLEKILSQQAAPNHYTLLAQLLEKGRQEGTLHFYASFPMYVMSHAQYKALLASKENESSYLHAYFFIYDSEDHSEDSKPTVLNLFYLNSNFESEDFTHRCGQLSAPELVTLACEKLGQIVEKINPLLPINEQVSYNAQDKNTKLTSSDEEFFYDFIRTTKYPNSDKNGYVHTCRNLLYPADNKQLVRLINGHVLYHQETRTYFVYRPERFDNSAKADIHHLRDEVEIKNGKIEICHGRCQPKRHKNKILKIERPPYDARQIAHIRERNKKILPKIKHLNCHMMVEEKKETLEMTVITVMNFIHLPDLYDLIQDPLHDDFEVIAYTLVKTLKKNFHDQHLLYLDVKPENIKYDRRKHRAIFIDPDTVQSMEDTHAMTGGFGTPPYLCEHDKNASTATDVYAMGVVLLQLYTHTKKIESRKEIEDLLDRVKQENSLWGDLINNMLQRNAADRCSLDEVLKTMPRPQVRSSSTPSLKLRLHSFIQSPSIRPLSRASSTTSMLFSSSSSASSSSLSSPDKHVSSSASLPESPAFLPPQRTRPTGGSRIAPFTKALSSPNTFFSGRSLNCSPSWSGPTPTDSPAASPSSSRGSMSMLRGSGEG